MKTEFGRGDRKREGRDEFHTYSRRETEWKYEVEWSEDTAENRKENER